MIIKQNPHLAGAAEAARGLPDFRNLGVVLRILLLVNGLAVVAVLLRNADAWLLLDELLDMAMRVEFPLILSVALLFLLQPWLARLSVLAGGLAVAGVVARLWLNGRRHGLVVTLYVAMGWAVVMAIQPLTEALGRGGLELLVAGGLAYTLGVVFYKWRSLPYSHAIWHLFVLAGSAFHYFAVLFYVIPLAT